MPKPYQPNDKWSQRAAEEGFRARSVYKLMELDERFHLLKPGMIVLDLGAAPGSWLQYAAHQVGPKGKVVGVDLQEIEPVADNVTTLVQDMTDIPALQKALDALSIDRVDLVLSDAAPNTSGTWDVDQWRSIELNQAVDTTAAAVLKPNGSCVMKVFRGADFDEFMQALKQTWSSVKMMKAKASRDRSKEVYVVVQGRVS